MFNLWNMESDSILVSRTTQRNEHPRVVLLDPRMLAFYRSGSDAAPNNSRCCSHTSMSVCPGLRSIRLCLR